MASVPSGAPAATGRAPCSPAGAAALDDERIRYFTYGSNMEESVMASHCPSHRYIGRAGLPEHRLAFTRRSARTGTGVADIVRADGRSVWGALYELDEAGLFAIDHKEGNGSNYQRTQVRVLPDGGEPYADVLTYAVIDPLDIDRGVPERLYFTDSDEANQLIATDPMALLVGFVLDQHWSGPVWSRG